MYKIGILGAAAIAPRSIIEPARRRNDVIIAAVASRRADVAAGYAQQHGIETAYSGYEALLQDDSIDIVYVALPPVHHAEWTIKSLKAGKHVLCEKPFAMNADEARRMVDTAAANYRILAEAFHYRHHPLFEHILSLRSELGKIAGLQAEFHVNIPWDPKDIRYDPIAGGGAMMDLGVYPLHWLRSFMGSEPEVVSATARLSELGADTRMEALLRFAGGIDARLVADIQDPPFRPWLRIEGTNATVEIDNPSSPHRGHSIRFRRDDIPREYTVAGGTTYDFQLAAMLKAVETGESPVTSGDDSIANMAAVDAIYTAAGITRPNQGGV